MRRLRPRIQRLLSLRRLVYGITSVLFTALLGVGIAALTSKIDLWAVPYLLAAFTGFGVLSLILRLLREDIVVPGIKPTPIRTPSEQVQYAHKGLIVLVSLYNPIGAATDTAKALSKDERLAAAKAGDYKMLDLLNSSLGPNVAAILGHASALQHCWFVSTTAQGADIAGSHHYVSPIIAYLQKEKNLQCSFHWEGYTIAMDDDALVCEKTYKVITRIYKEAKDLGLPPTAMIADFTGGVRSMTLGTVLATLSEDRDMQFMGTRYNDYAQPEGPLFPIIYQFGPQLPATD